MADKSTPKQESTSKPVADQAADKVYVDLKDKPDPSTVANEEKS